MTLQHMATRQPASVEPMALIGPEPKQAAEVIRERVAFWKGVQVG